MYDIGKGAATKVAVETVVGGLKPRYDGIVKSIEGAAFTCGAAEKVLVVALFREYVEKIANAVWMVY